MPIQCYAECPGCKKLVSISHYEAANPNALIGKICLRCGYQFKTGDTTRTILKG